MSARVDPVPKRVRQSYSSIFRPFRLWLQVIGVHLPVTHISFGWRLVAWTYSFCWIVANIASHVHFILHVTINNDTWKTKVYSWNDIILFGNYTILDIGTHLGLSLVLQWKWTVMWTSFEKMEAKLKPTSSTYRKCQYAITASLGYVGAKVTLDIKWGNFT